MEFTPGVYRFQGLFLPLNHLHFQQGNNLLNTILKRRIAKKTVELKMKEVNSFCLYMHGSQGGVQYILFPLQNGFDKVLPLPLQNPYPGKSRGFGIPVLGAPLDPPMLSTILFLVCRPALHR